ncbi:hypothetical protein, partial [Pseudorhodobacter sp.]|uniref:hypothetical protein n=1 Tax=Pseudorhodobacter sp. TaxID=1934400 RepID=UPI002648FFE1
MKVTRIFLGVVLLGSVLGFGYAARSPWVIVPLAVIFALSFALGRWRGWRIAWNTGGIAAAIRAQGSTILAQAVVVAVLYLLGRGVGAL